MASDHRSRLQLKILGTQSPPAPYLDEVRYQPIAVDLTLLEGVLDSQFNALFAVENSLGIGASATYDLKTALDPYGVALNLDDAVLVWLQNKDTSAGILQMRAGSVNGWTNFLGTAADVNLRAGNANLQLALNAGDLLVTPTNKVLEVQATGGSCDYALSIWGRRP